MSPMTPKVNLSFAYAFRMLPKRRWLVSAASGIAVIAVAIGSMVPIVGQTKVAAIDETIPPGANFDKAEFRFWIPQDSGPVRAVVVLVPGSNGDGRPMADDTFWQAFATTHKLAIVACRFTDKPHEQAFIEDYVNVSKGSGQALLDVLARFATRSAHPEVAAAPLLMWGMSAGGQFNYEFTAWKPERVAAFVVNKGGIYYSALLSKAARAVPGLLFVGSTDLQSRIDTITGLFAVNRRGGAVWALVSEPGLGHVVGNSRELGALFFEEALASTAPGPGFVGDLKTFAVQPAATPGTPSTPNAWLISERFAKAWQAVVRGARTATFPTKPARHAGGG